MNEIPEGYIAVPESAWHELVQYELRCQELAATVEALKLPLKALLETPLGFGGSLQADGQFAYRVRESVFKKAESALAATPQQHLAEIRAQAGYRGFMECARIYCTEEHFTPHPATGMTAIKGAHQYADSIRRGEVK